MTQWSKEDLEEICGDDIIGQLAFLSGCFKHHLSNDKVVPDGWIIPDELLRKFAELIVRECKLAINQIDADDASMAVGLYRAEVALENLFGVKK